jgi:glucose/arabinose dehydrogenase
MKMQVIGRWALFALVGLSGCGDDTKGGGAPRDAAAVGAMDAAADAQRGEAGAPPLEAGTPQPTDARVDATALPLDGSPLDGSPNNPGNEAGVVPGDDARVDAGPPPCDPTIAPVLPQLALAPVVSERDRLVYAAQPPGSSDWYLVHQKGRVDVFTGGAVRTQAFLDLSSRFAQNPSEGDERGLLGLAFAPDYAASGKFYVMFTPSMDGDPDQNQDVVLEYQRSASDPFVADPGSRKLLVALDLSAVNHNGGQLVFGPDGMLYVGTGDGGAGCNDNQPNESQQPDSLFGKILRLDPKAAPPFAAAGNPYSGATGDARVLHYGLRNPFRFGFDSLTGDLYIGDVGQNSYEEISLAPSGAKGLNFGWAAFEGDHGGTCPGRALATGAQHTKPIVDIDVRDNAPANYPFRDYVSVIAGPVYRGTAIPALQGVFLFGDYTGIRMGALRQCGAQTSPISPILKTRDPNSQDRSFTLPAMFRFSALTAIVSDNAGELYFVANRSTLLKLVPGQ